MNIRIVVLDLLILVLDKYFVYKAVYSFDANLIGEG